LLEAINKRKQKLLEEGLFDAIHKKPLPFFPKKIAVITSKTGAVIQDIINRISARCPTHILLYPSLMQGNQAAIEIIAGIKFLNKLGERIDEVENDIFEFKDYFYPFGEK
jgi:exodeoxyribonuclease VII large subunit